MLRYFENAKQAAQYVIHRPALTREVKNCIMSFYKTYQTKQSSSKPSLMVDVGCGSGQATQVFQRHFDKIIGIDISAQQLNQAKRQNTYENIQYLEGRAENMPVNTGSVDLMIASASAHWFDLPKFFLEAERALTPHSGCLALIGYYIPAMRLLAKKDDDILAKKAMQLCEDFHFSCAKDKNELSFPLNLPRKMYKDIFEMIPFETKERNDTIHLRCLSSLNGICGLLRSFSSYQSFLDKEFMRLQDNQPDFAHGAMSKVDPLLKCV